eukprot:Rmarinus@m.12859
MARDLPQSTKAKMSATAAGWALCSWHRKRLLPHTVDRPLRAETKSRAGVGSVLPHPDRQAKRKPWILVVVVVVVVLVVLRVHVQVRVRVRLLLRAPSMPHLPPQVPPTTKPLQQNRPRGMWSLVLRRLTRLGRLPHA